MDAGLLAQYVVIALAVLASVVVVMRKQFPNATRRLRIAVALPLLAGALVSSTPVTLALMGAG